MEHQNTLKELAQISDLRFIETSQKPEQTAVAVAGEIEIFVPFQQLFDVKAERQRVEKEILKTRQDVASFEGKLSNQNFVERAPKEVVEKERLRLKEFKEKLVKLEMALKQL